MAKNLDYIEKRVLELEQEVTDIHLRGAALVPSSKMDYLRLNEIRKELEDITDGENTLIGNMAGQFEPSYTVEPKEGEQYLNYWPDELTGVSSSKTGEKLALPTFIRNMRVRKCFHVSKYKMSAIYNQNSPSTHTNYAVGLYNLSPAHSTGGFTVSYDGIVDKLNQINNSTFPSYMPESMQDYCKKKHLITWDEYGYLCLLAKKYAFEPLGNSSQGADTKGYMAPSAEYRRAENGLYKISQTRNGVGPNYWRHNGKFTGIADLVGNCRTLIAGAKIVSGIIQVIDFTNTDGLLTPSDLKSSGPLWKAIKTDGTLIAPDTVNGSSVKAFCIDFVEQPTANSQKNTFISDEILIRDNGFYGIVSAKDVTLKEGLTANYLLELLGFLPFKNGGLAGSQYLRNTENLTTCCQVGGDWWHGSSAGLRYLYGYATFGYASNAIGALSASD